MNIFQLKIKTRLTLQFTLIVAFILIVFSLSIYYLSSSYRESEFYERLENKALTTARILVNVKAVDYNLLKIIDKNTANLMFNERVAVFDYKNRIIYKSMDNDSIHINKEQLGTIRLNNKLRYKIGENEVLGLLYKNKNNWFVVVVSALDKYGLSKLSYLKFLLIITFLLSILFTILIGRVFAKQALEPMSDVVKQVDKINAASLNMRVKEGNGTDEIAQLAITFNKMLERLEWSFEMQRSFVSNASHELRTPLTSITGQIEVSLLKEREKEDYVRVLESVLEDIKNLNGLSNGLLDLAKVSSDISELSLKNLRIDELVWEARGELLKLKKEYTVLIQFKNVNDDEKKLMVFGNDYLLKTAISNMMDNGCKYSPQNTIEVFISAGEKYVAVEFVDKGIGIDNEDVEKIFQPFYRAKNVKNIHGNGLGLSLTEKIIKIHGGEITLTSELNKGTKVVIRIPNK